MILTATLAAARRQAPKPLQRDLMQVSFPARDGRGRVDGWYLASHAPAGQPAVAVLLHRQEARRVDASRPPQFGLAQVLAAAGFAVLVIDRGDQGAGSRTGITEDHHERFDMLGAVDWLRERGHRRVVVPGLASAWASALLAGVDLLRGAVPGRVV